MATATAEIPAESATMAASSALALDSMSSTVGNGAVGASAEPSGAAEETGGIKFKVNQRLLVQHLDLLYVAKILEIDEEKGLYKIHYDKWNSKWDEWVGLDRMYEDTEENRKLAERKKQELLNKSTKRSAPATTGSNKRKRDQNPTMDDPEDDKEDNDKLDDPPPVRLNLSDDLKNHVIRDWENLTQNGKVCDLPKPADKTVTKILGDFKASKKKAAVFAQICDGISVYFERALPTILLYRAERAQYERLRAEHPDLRNCDLYGGEHLLRLFVRLPNLLANTDLDDAETKQLCARLQDLIRFMSKESSKYFSDNDSGYIPNSFTQEASSSTSPAPATSS